MARLYTRQEVRRRRMKFQIFAGMFDFLAVMAGIVVVIACVILIAALVRWVLSDAPVTFKTLWDIFMKAIIVPE